MCRSGSTVGRTGEEQPAAGCHREIDCLRTERHCRTPKDPATDLLRRHLRYRTYRFGLFAAIVTWTYLLLALAALVLLWYYQLFPDPQVVDATFEAVPAIMPTSPLFLALLMSLDSIEFGPVLATLVLVVSGLVQASVRYVVLRGRRRVAPEAALA